MQTTSPIGFSQIIIKKNPRPFVWTIETFNKLKLTREDFRVAFEARTGVKRYLIVSIFHIHAETWRAFSLNSEISVFPTVTRRGGSRV